MEIKYIEHKISIKSIRDFILDFGLTENDTIILNSINFDDIVLEHREIYNESFEAPYLILSVLIKEDTQKKVPQNRVGIIKNDTNSIRKINEYDDSEFYDEEVAFRCGWCGNIVAENGEVLEGEERRRKIKYIESHPNPSVKHINGMCCRDRAFH